MVTKYQVESKFKSDSKWQEDHLPFDIEKEAIEYINTQPKCFQYRIVSYKEPETDSEWLDFHDAWDALGGDWQG